MYCDSEKQSSPGVLQTEWLEGSSEEWPVSLLHQPQEYHRGLSAGLRVAQVNVMRFTVTLTEGSVLCWETARRHSGQTERQEEEVLTF